MFQLSIYIGDYGVQLYVICLVLLTIFFLYKEIYNTSIVFLAAVAFLIAPGIINTQDILTSFANEQVAVIVMLLAIGQFLKRSPVIEELFQ